MGLFLFSRLMMPYIYTKFYENIWKGLGVIVWT